jgi:hypothetical protein
MAHCTDVEPVVPEAGMVIGLASSLAGSSSTGATVGSVSLLKTRKTTIGRMVRQSMRIVNFFDIVRIYSILLYI